VWILRVVVVMDWHFGMMTDVPLAPLVDTSHLIIPFRIIRTHNTELPEVPKYRSAQTNAQSSSCPHVCLPFDHSTIRPFSHFVYMTDPKPVIIFRLMFLLLILECFFPICPTNPKSQIPPLSLSPAVPYSLLSSPGPRPLLDPFPPHPPSRSLRWVSKARQGRGEGGAMRGKARQGVSCILCCVLRFGFLSVSQ